MKRTALSPLAHRSHLRLARRPPPSGSPAPAQPKATPRTLGTDRATRSAYLNAFCAFLQPPAQ